MAAGTFAPYSEAVRRFGGANLMTGQGPRRDLLRRERGQVLVEFIVILPIFLAITFAVIEFGKGLNYWIDMTHLANEGARYAAVNRWPTCPSNDTEDCDEQLREWIQSRANTAELAEGGTSNVPGGGLGYATPPTTADGIRICFEDLGDDGDANIGESVRVTVSAPYRLALVDGLLDVVGFDGVIDLSASATMRLERTPTGNRLLAEDAGECA
jgi:Flp pilus assembly protein TadG